MKQCKRCGMKIKDEVLDCPRCGNKEFSIGREVPVKKVVEKPKKPIENMQTAVKLTKKQEADRDKDMVVAMKKASMDGVAFDMQKFNNEWIRKNVIEKKVEEKEVIINQLSIMYWFTTLFLLCIPGVNIGICIKGFKSENKNFYKAFLAYYCLMIIVGLIIRFFR